MPRTHKRKLDARWYKTYDEETMAKAVDAVKGGESFLGASRRFGINRTTLMNHVKGDHIGTVGHPTVLSTQERLLVNSLQKISDWGFGVTKDQVPEMMGRNNVVALQMNFMDSTLLTGSMEALLLCKGYTNIPYFVKHSFR